MVSIKREQSLSTQQVADFSGATVRQLQWWDERGILEPRHEGHRRLYTPAQAALAKKYVQLRKAGVGKALARKLMADAKVSGRLLVVAGERSTILEL